MASKRSARKSKSSSASRSSPASTRKKAPGGAKGKAASSRNAKAPAGAEDQVARIQRLIAVMVDAGAVEVEMEEAGSKLRVRLQEERPLNFVTSGGPVATPDLGELPVAGRSRSDGGQSPAAVGEGTASQPAGAFAADGEEGEVFLSPMVGTFYRAPSPETEPFANVGDLVQPETTLCIIEAMKVMNEIKAEMEGQVLAILVENGEPVEFGQPLFRIKR